MKCFRHVCYWFNCENNRKKTVDMSKLKNNPLIHFNLNGTDVLKECLEYLKKNSFLW